jgi:hypothetical protein
MTEDDSLKQAEDLLTRLENARTRLETTEDPDAAIEILGELAEIAKEVEAALTEAQRQANAQP